MNRAFPRNPGAWAPLLLAALCAPLLAADELPKAETILDKYLEVTGGKAAYRKLRTEVMSGTMELAANGIKGTITAWHAEPDKTLMEVEIQGVGQIRDGYDGNIAWSLSAIQGPHIKLGDEKTEAARQARFNAELHWQELYPKAETTGIEDVGGKPCYKVVLTPKDGNPVTRYYDKQSNLLVKVTMTAKTAMGEVPVESTVGDYRKDGEILAPHRVTQKAGGQEFSITVDKIEYNTEIPSSKFDPPAEVKALANKK
jgi:hypothetical protein